MKNLKYSYIVDHSKEEHTLFDNLKLKIKPGTSNAIVGASGFGKTTLFNMFYRLLDPSSGDIILDGQNLRDMSFDSF